MLDGFDEVISNTWGGIVDGVERNKAIHFKNKLNELKEVLKEWNKNDKQKEKKNEKDIAMMNLKS